MRILTQKYKKRNQFLQMSTIFGKPRHSRIVFCIDASDRLKTTRKIIAQHIETHLLQMSNTFKFCKFNVILFAEKILKFSADMLDVSPEVFERLRIWIQMASLGSMSFVLPGLLSAVNNTEFCCIYFVTDGEISDCEPVLLTEIYQISTQFSIYAFLILEKLPPNKEKLRLFQGTNDAHKDPWSAVTLVTTRKEAETIGIATVNFDSSEISSCDNDDDCVVDSGVNTWLEQQAAGARLVSEPREQDNGCANNSQYPIHNHGSPEGVFKAGCQENLNHCRISRADSGTNSIPSAGGLLLGRHVLAPRRDEDGRLFLGVVKTQKPGKRFGIVYCLPFVEHNDNLDYCYQDVLLEDILSYGELYRHSLKPDDDALVPELFLTSVDTKRKVAERVQMEPPYAGEAYVLTKIYRGYEQRSQDWGGDDATSSLLIVQKLTSGHGRPQYCEIPRGCALWIPPIRAAALRAEGCHFFDTEKYHDNESPIHETKESLCMHGSPKRRGDKSPGHNHDDHEDEAEATSIFRQSCENDSSFTQPTQLKSKRRPIKGHHSSLRTSVDSALSRSGSTSSIFNRGKSYDARKGERGSNSELGNASDVSSAHEKRSQSSSRRSRSRESANRPPWQYWGRGQIPEIIDPPVFEPYIPMQTFGPATIANKDAAAGEWPSSQFVMVNHNQQNVTAQNDSSRVYAALQQISGRPERLEDAGGVIRSESYGSGVDKVNEVSFTNPCAESLDGTDEGLTGTSLREIYRRRMVKNQKESKGKRRKNSGSKSVKSH